MGIILVGAFIFNESRAKSPVIDLKMFRYRLLGYSLTATFLQAIGD